jgi:methylenetetrahydrofolate reductase (NADH)
MTVDRNVTRAKALAKSRTCDPDGLLGAAALVARSRLEVMPFDSVEQQVAGVPRSTVLTLTCSPKHGIARTLDFAQRLRARGFPVVPHISARMVANADDLAQIAAAVRDSAIEEVFVIGGDRSESLGPYATAEELLEVLAPRIEGIRIGIAGYPAGHPAIRPNNLTRALLAKQPFASVIVTQMCFDASLIGAWIRSIRAAGVVLPVLLGVPGVVDRRKLLELSVRVGVGASTRYLRNNLTTATRLLRGSSYRPDALIAELACETAGLGVVGLHIFTFNELAATSAWRATVDARRKQP